MCREPKRKRTLSVKRMFEPDRMSLFNLQAAYEQVIPPRQYAIIPFEQEPAKRSEELVQKEEVSV
jgi:hypothetical protein